MNFVNDMRALIKEIIRFSDSETKRLLKLVAAKDKKIEHLEKALEKSEKVQADMMAQLKSGTATLKDEFIKQVDEVKKESKAAADVSVPEADVNNPTPAADALVKKADNGKEANSAPVTAALSSTVDSEEETSDSAVDAAISMLIPES